MATAALETFLHTLRRSLGRTGGERLTDGELLECFIARRDEAAFAALVQRHGPMVLGVSRRVLRNEADVEDAFQATFLVLVRKAATIRPRGRVGNWLYGVAHSTALKARALSARRSAHERAAAARPRPESDSEAREQLRAVLDQELAALPERYRAAVVLCDLEGKTIKEAAHQLGCPPGTAWSWLSRGRGLLSLRLARHGLAVSGALIAAAAASPATAGVPARLVDATVKAAATGAVSANSAALSEGVVRAMSFVKLKIAACVVAAAVLGVGTGRLPHPARAEAQDGPQDPASQVQRAEAQLAAAQAALRQAEANLAAVRAAAAPRRTGPRESGTAQSAIAARFRYRVPVEIGLTETAAGGRIDILEIWGTRPRIEVGGSYIVRGRYTMPEHEKGMLYFYETARGDWGNGWWPILDIQTATVRKGQGEFTLMHTMAGPGYFHLQLHGENQGKSQQVANVYFGSGDTVMRKW